MPLLLYSTWLASVGMPGTLGRARRVHGVICTGSCVQATQLIMDLPFLEVADIISYGVPPEQSRSLTQHDHVLLRSRGTDTQQQRWGDQEVWESLLASEGSSPEGSRAVTYSAAFSRPCTPHARSSKVTG